MNLQLAMVLVTSLSLILGAAAFIFVIWPSIRNAERRGARLERWLEGAEAKELFAAAKSKLLGFDSSGKPASKDAFLRECLPGQEEGETVRL